LKLRFTTIENDYTSRCRAACAVRRTIWLDAVRTHFPNLAAVSTALKKESVGILNSLSSLTKARAPSWQPSFPKLDQIRQEGDFAKTYSG
jgi:tagatose 1,6-diphosphate aldolase